MASQNWRWFTWGMGSATLIGALAVTVTLGIVANSDSSDEPPKQVVVTVEVGTVQDTVVATPQVVPVSAVAVTRQGVNTNVGAVAGQSLSEGDVVTIVDEQASVLIRGSFPFYRDLEVGMTGQDVGQLQDSLKRLGYLDSSKNDVFDAATSKAVISLFEGVGYPLRSGNSAASADNLVVSRDLLVVSKSLPARPDKDCGTLGELAAGTVCSLLSEATDLLVSLSTSDAGTVEPGMSVVLGLADGSTKDTVLGSPLPVADEDATQSFSIEDVVDEDDRITTVTIVRAASAPESFFVPAQALTSAGGNAATLILANGSQMDVSIGMCAAGKCVVSGKQLEAGQEVRIP